MSNNALRRNGAALAAYVAVGGICAIVEWSLFWVLLNLGVHYFIAALLAFVLATFVNYLICVRTIFVSKTSSVRSDIARVFIASALAYSVNLLVLVLLVTEFGVAPMTSKVAGTGVGFLFNFASRQFVIFTPSTWLSSRSSGKDSRQ